MDQIVRKVLRKHVGELENHVRECKNLYSRYPAAYDALRLAKKGVLDPLVIRVVRRAEEIVSPNRPVVVYPVMHSGYFLGRVLADVLKEMGYLVDLRPIHKDEHRRFTAEVPDYDHHALVVDDRVVSGSTVERIARDIPALRGKPFLYAATRRTDDFVYAAALSTLSYLLLNKEQGIDPLRRFQWKKRGRETLLD